MPKLARKLRPKNGFAHLVHLLLTALLPLLAYVFVSVRLVPLAVGLVLVAKWRMFAVRPRYWLANIRANAVDIMVGLSIVVFMDQSLSIGWRLVWALAYGVWLLVIKPGSSIPKISMQAIIGQTVSLMALFIALGDAPLYVLVPAVWAICYFSARHFFTSFDEAYYSMFAHGWGYSGAALTWVLGHWLLYYGLISQPTLLLSVLGFGCATLYYLDHTDRLSVLWRRQFVFIMIAVVAVVLVFSDWGDKAIK